MGTHLGLVQIWDAATEKKLSTLPGHMGRVGKKDTSSQSDVVYISIFSQALSPGIVTCSAQGVETTISSSGTTGLLRRRP